MERARQTVRSATVVTVGHPHRVEMGTPNAHPKSALTEKSELMNELTDSLCCGLPIQPVFNTRGMNLAST